MWTKILTIILGVAFQMIMEMLKQQTTKTAAPLFPLAKKYTTQYEEMRDTLTGDERYDLAFTNIKNEAEFSNIPWTTKAIDLAIAIAVPIAEEFVNSKK